MMKATAAATLMASTLLWAHAAIAQSGGTPLELKSLYPGLSKAQLLALEPTLQCRSIDADQRALAGGGDTLCINQDASLGGSASKMTVTLADERVMLILFGGIDSRDYERLSTLLIDKFGPADEEGFPGDGRLLRWLRDGRRLQLTEFDRRRATSVALVAEADASEALQRIRKAREDDL